MFKDTSMRFLSAIYHKLVDLVLDFLRLGGKWVIGLQNAFGGSGYVYVL